MNEENEIAKSELVSWIGKSVENERFLKSEINFTGVSEKADGYTGNMVYATVIGTTKENIEKVINLFIKYGKKNEQLRRACRTRQIFEREIYFYDFILPLYTKFQLEHNVENVFDSVPRCWKTLILDNMEAIVMENLKKKGYAMYDRRKPLNLNHIKLLLREYGKFHAISFAFRDQRNEEFKKLLKNYDDLMPLFFRGEDFTKNIKSTVATACTVLEEMGETELLEKYETIQERGAHTVILEILDAVESQSAVLHGDCWNNNFLFKYQGEDRSSPTKVAILDWQVSKLHSPVLDLSNFFYIVSSRNELDHFGELIEIYYDSFSSFLSQLGSDPEKLFPFSALKRHWEKYSLFGVLLATLYLQLTICDQEEVPNVNNLTEDQGMGELFNVQIKDQKQFRERLTAVISHHYTYKF